MFSGTTYNPLLDGPRLKRQLDLVFDKMIDGRWHTLTELAECSGGTEAAVSARIRDDLLDGQNLDAREYAS